MQGIHNINRNQTTNCGNLHNNNKNNDDDTNNIDHHNTNNNKTGQQPVNSCLTACISISVYNAHDISSDPTKGPMGESVEEKLRVVGFRNNRVEVK